MCCQCLPNAEVRVAHLSQDHFRPYVKPLFTEVSRDRDGVVGYAEFETYDEMKLAVKKCDDSEFK